MKTNTHCGRLALALLCALAACEDEGAGDAVGAEIPDAEITDAEILDAEITDAEIPDLGPPMITAIEAPAQRPLGDPDAGWDYLRYGDFVGTGMPIDVFKRLVGVDDENLLGREGDSADLPPFANAFDGYNGVRVAAGTTCMGCHGSALDGQFIPGLGNTVQDFTRDVSGIFNLLERFLENEFEAGSPEAEISALYLRGARSTQDQIRMAFKGPNPAMRMAVAAAAHRRPGDLSWQETLAFEIPESTLASDVPPLWGVRKKHALYYNGMGRGDFARLIMQIGVVAIVDAEQAAQIDAHAPDLLAWIESLEPPPWPGEIDAARAEAGAAIFEARCAHCHGTYGAEETYPNLWVPAEIVGTDPEYARYFATDNGFISWFNQSWYAADGLAWAEAREGYVAPPLDGIWATAPYLHNGSVPTLAALLDSAARPARWRRDYEDSTYDHVAVGWPWAAPEAGAEAVDIYDTAALGYSNVGHTYADDLDGQARLDLLEYLKTL